MKFVSVKAVKATMHSFFVLSLFLHLFLVSSDSAQLNDNSNIKEYVDSDFDEFKINYKKDIDHIWDSLFSGKKLPPSSSLIDCLSGGSIFQIKFDALNNMSRKINNFLMSIGEKKISANYLIHHFSKFSKNIFIMNKIFPVFGKKNSKSTLNSNLKRLLKVHNDLINDADFELIKKCSEDLKNIHCRSYIAYSMLYGLNGIKHDPIEAKKIFNELAHLGESKSLFISSVLSSIFDDNVENEFESQMYLNLAMLTNNPDAILAMADRKYDDTFTLNSCQESISLLLNYLDVRHKEFQFFSLNPYNFKSFIDKSPHAYSKEHEIHLTDSYINFYNFAMEKSPNNIRMITSLGYTYLFGIGHQDIDYKRALHYFNLAREIGFWSPYGILAKFYISDFYGIGINYTLALQYAQEAASHDVASGYFVLGYLNEFNLIPESSIHKALGLYSIASELGEPLADQRLVVNYLSENLATYNRSKGLYYLRRSYMHDNPEALPSSLNSSSNIITKFGCQYLKNVLFSNFLGTSNHIKLKYAYKAFHDGKFDSALLRFIELAEMGIKPAKENVVYIIDHGFYSGNFFNKKNLIRLRNKYLVSSASDGSDKLKHLLADDLDHGYNFHQNSMIASSIYFELAEKSNNSESFYKIANLMKSGKYLSSNYTVIKKYLEMAELHSTGTKIFFKISKFHAGLSLMWINYSQLMKKACAITLIGILSLFVKLLI